MKAHKFLYPLTNYDILHVFNVFQGRVY